MGKAGKPDAVAKVFSTPNGTNLPPDLHSCGYEGLAAAIVYECLVDIVSETRMKLNNGRDPYDETSMTWNYCTAVKFLRRKHNELYRLDIPGPELIEMTIRRTVDDWKRRKQ